MIRTWMISTLVAGAVAATLLGGAGLSIEPAKKVGGDAATQNEDTEIAAIKANVDAFSKAYQARDAKAVFGWRYSPRIMFKSGKGVKLIDMDGNEYYDMSSGMMCMVLGHSHPELTEVIKEMAGTFIHQSSWYSNPWTVEFAERLTEHAPGKLKVVVLPPQVTLTV